MQALVICHPAAGGDQARFSSMLAEEMAVLRRMKADGTLIQAWSPGRPGAVLMLDVPGPAEAEALAAHLPLAVAGLITTEIIPLTPLDL